MIWNPGHVVGSPYSTIDLGFFFVYGFRSFTQREQGYERKEDASYVEGGTAEDEKRE